MGPDPPSRVVHFLQQTNKSSLPGNSLWPFWDGEFTWPFGKVAGDLQRSGIKVGHGGWMTWFIIFPWVWEGFRRSYHHHITISPRWVRTNLPFQPVSRILRWKILAFALLLSHQGLWQVVVSGRFFCGIFVLRILTPQKVAMLRT